MEVALFVFAQLVTAAGVYAAIRADLRENKVEISNLKKRVQRFDGIEA